MNLYVINICGIKFVYFNIHSDLCLYNTEILQIVTMSAEQAVY